MLGRFAAKNGRRFEVPSEKGERVGRLRGWPRFDDDGPATTPAEASARGDASHGACRHSEGTRASSGTQRRM